MHHCSCITLSRRDLDGKMKSSMPNAPTRANALRRRSSIASKAAVLWTSHVLLEMRAGGWVVDVMASSVMHHHGDVLSCAREDLFAPFQVDGAHAFIVDAKTLARGDTNITHGRETTE